MFKKLFQAVDQNLLEQYAKLTRPLPNYAVAEAATNYTTTSLMTSQLSETWSELVEKQQEYTRQFWRDLSLKYGAHILMTCTQPTLDVLEDAMVLDPGSRPAWVKVSTVVPAKGELYFLRCACICHEPRSLTTKNVAVKRVLLTNGKWCCECSAYEDVL